MESAASVTASPHVGGKRSSRASTTEEKQRAGGKAEKQIKLVTSRDSMQSRGRPHGNGRKAGSKA